MVCVRLVFELVCGMLCVPSCLEFAGVVVPLLVVSACVCVVLQFRACLCVLACWLSFRVSLCVVRFPTVVFDSCLRVLCSGSLPVGCSCCVVLLVSLAWCIAGG